MTVAEITEQVNAERLDLIEKKHRSGLSAAESARLKWLQREIVKLIPSFTKSDFERLDALRERLDHDYRQLCDDLKDLGV